MTSKLIILFALISTSLTFIEVDIPEPKIAREVEKTLKISDFELEIQDSLSIKCIGQEQYSKQINIINGEEFLGNVFVRRVHTCDPNACNDLSLVASENPEDLEYFDYFIIINKDSIVKNITVYNYQATHGHDVAKRSWIAQFIDKQAEDLIYKENIDGISGATVSAQNFTFEIEYLLDCYKGE